MRAKQTDEAVHILVLIVERSCLIRSNIHRPTNTRRPVTFLLSGLRRSACT